MDLIMELCYYKSEGVAGSWLRLSSHLGFQTTWHNDKLQRNGCEASGRDSGKVCGLDSALIRWTQGSTLMWQSTGFSGFTLFGLFKKQTLTGRRLWEPRRSTGPFEKKPII